MEFEVDIKPYTELYELYNNVAIVPWQVHEDFTDFANRFETSVVPVVYKENTIWAEVSSIVEWKEAGCISLRPFLNPASPDLIADPNYWSFSNPDEWFVFTPPPGGGRNIFQNFQARGLLRSVPQISKFWMMSREKLRPEQEICIAIQIWPLQYWKPPPEPAFLVVELAELAWIIGDNIYLARKKVGWRPAHRPELDWEFFLTAKWDQLTNRYEIIHDFKEGALTKAVGNQPLRLTVFPIYRRNVIYCSLDQGTNFKPIKIWDDLDDLELHEYGAATQYWFPPSPGIPLIFRGRTSLNRPLNPAGPVIIGGNIGSISLHFFNVHYEEGSAWMKERPRAKIPLPVDFFIEPLGERTINWMEIFYGGLRETPAINPQTFIQASLDTSTVFGDWNITLKPIDERKTFGPWSIMRSPELYAVTLAHFRHRYILPEPEKVSFLGLPTEFQNTPAQGFYIESVSLENSFESASIRLECSLDEKSPLLDARLEGRPVFFRMIWEEELFDFWCEALIISSSLNLVSRKLSLELQPMPAYALSLPMHENVPRFENVPLETLLSEILAAGGCRNFSLLSQVEGDFIMPKEPHGAQGHLVEFSGSILSSLNELLANYGLRLIPLLWNGEILLVRAPIQEPVECHLQIGWNPEKKRFLLWDSTIGRYLPGFVTAWTRGENIRERETLYTAEAQTRLKRRNVPLYAFYHCFARESPRLWKAKYPSPVRRGGRPSIRTLIREPGHLDLALRTEIGKRAADTIVRSIEIKEGGLEIFPSAVIEILGAPWGQLDGIYFADRVSHNITGTSITTSIELKSYYWGEV